MADSSIEWTDSTWNPVAGCTVITAGCTNCYAMRMAARLAAMGQPKYNGLTRKSGRRHVWTDAIRCDEKALDAPGKWRKPRRIFVNSMSDLFHENVPIPFIRKVWRVMRDTPRHTYQILTKRPERMVQVAPHLPLLSNVWLGTSVEDDRVLDRIDALRQVRAAIRFVSFEPLIGSVARANLTGIDWVIVGGESGPHARAMDPEWVSEIEATCRKTGIAFFFKQWGGTNKNRSGRLFRGKIVDEMPAAIRLEHGGLDRRQSDLVPKLMCCRTLKEALTNIDAGCLFP
jgi:protein gp37